MKATHPEYDFLKARITVVKSAKGSQMGNKTSFIHAKRENARCMTSHMNGEHAPKK